MSNHRSFISQPNRSSASTSLALREKISGSPMGLPKREMVRVIGLPA
jgi:hypothetical protein